MSDYSQLPQKSTKFSSCGCRFFIKIVVFLLAITVIYIGVIIWNKLTEPKLTPVILTSDGPVQGNIKYSRDGQEYWQFLGIPYGRKPTEKLNFKPPVPIEPWETVKQVIRYPPACAQSDVILTGRAVGDMDCLFLNVFVNVDKGNKSKLAVLLYIHGGAFLSGASAMYQPDYFMDQDVVLVTMNYRLGPYGFLNLENGNNDKTDVAQGNMGMKDQTLVLQWIQKNIAQFGGDPQRVTLFGESAGAVATQLHVLSPMSRGLFHRAVVQSGTALTSWGFSLKPRDIAKEHANNIGCSLEKEDDLLKCYENTEWKDVVKYQYCLLEPLLKKDFFEPTIDGTFIKERPQDIMKSQDFPPIPIMFGVNSAEGGIRTGRFEAMPELIPKLDMNWTDYLTSLMLLESPLPAEVAMEIRKQYFGNMTFMDNLEDFLRNLTLMMSDSGFFESTHRSAILHAKNGAPTYLYYYNYTSKIYPGLYSVYKTVRLDDWIPSEIKLMWSMGVDWVTQFIFGGLGSRKYGISHGEGGFQLWNVEGVTKHFSGPDSEFSRSFVKALVDFATNDLNENPLSFRNVTWPSINDHLSSGEDEFTIPYMLLDNEDESKVIPEPFAGRIKF